MSDKHNISHSDLEALRGFDTCVLSNAIELLNLRPRSEGYISDPNITCMFPRLAPVAGFAVTARMRSASQPIHGHYYYDHKEWWQYVASMPQPRIIVMQDADNPPGTGALFGELHARICMALNCVAYVSNGTVRDLPGIEKLGFQLFARGISVSHAYAHVVDFGQEVEIGGLKIKPGDVLQGDVHGVLSVPHAVVHQLPALASQMLAAEGEFISECLDGNFSIDRLSAAIRRHAEEHRRK